MVTDFDPIAGGILLVDKPVGWSSFDVVKKVRGALRSILGYRVKVGHAGTLDPLASGLLVLGVGRSTKLLPGLTEHGKAYTATIRLGERTPSYDAETEVIESKPWEHITPEEVEAALGRFRGEFQQRPPDFSAKHFQGERAYFLARDGAVIDLPLHTVQVDRLEMVGIQGQELSVAVHCSKGTYIRSLAHDIGQALGCGAHLSVLRRTRSGPYDVANAYLPEQWSQWFDEWAKAHPRPPDQENSG